MPVRLSVALMCDAVNNSPQPKCVIWFVVTSRSASFDLLSQAEVRHLICCHKPKCVIRFVVTSRSASFDLLSQAEVRHLICCHKPTCVIWFVVTSRSASFDLLSQQIKWRTSAGDYLLILLAGISNYIILCCVVLRLFHGMFYQRGICFVNNCTFNLNINIHFCRDCCFYKRYWIMSLCDFGCMMHIFHV